MCSDSRSAQGIIVCYLQGLNGSSGTLQSLGQISDQPLIPFPSPPVHMISLSIFSSSLWLFKYDSRVGL